MSIILRILKLTTLFIYGLSFGSPEIIESALLINLADLKELSNENSSTQRRASIPDNDLSIATNQINENFPDQSSITTTFAASHTTPIPTTAKITAELQISFGNNPSFEDLGSSIQLLSNNKTSYNLSNAGFLSALKSLLTAYINAGGDTEDFNSLPETILSNVLPNVPAWSESGLTWIKSLSQTLVESLSNLPSDQFHGVIEEFTKNVISLTDNTSDLHIRINDSLQNQDGDKSLDDLKIFSLATDRNDVVQENQSDDPLNKFKFNHQSTNVLQQFVVGLTQGAFSKFAQIENTELLKIGDLEDFSGSSNPSTNSVELPSSVVGSVIKGVLNSPVFVEESKKEFAYEYLKASANGFLISTTVITTSQDNYTANNLHLDGAEKIAKSISRYALLNHTVDDTEKKSFTVSNLQPDRIAESISLGSAMGSQLATVLPKSMEYSNSWEIQTNIRRELAKAVAKGNANGTTESTSLLSTLNDPDDENKKILEIEDIEDAARGSSLGAMMGNTGLAVYYPTKQMVPIINFTAQGSAIGSTNSLNLGDVETSKTESIEVSVARQSAVGSSLGASFEPSVLLGLRPDLRSRDTQTINHLEAASFGATYGALLGIELNTNLQSSPSADSSNVEEKSIIVKQATKQGSVEGALAGAKLALGLEDLKSDNLKSKAEILKAINKSNSNAASTNNNAAVVNFQTNPNDMLLLMNKFGINPRFTNSAKVYKRPVIIQTDEAPLDDEADNAIQNASPI